MSAGTGTRAPDRRRQLEDERDFLLRSIEDLDEELAAGDMSVPDHRVLRDRYTARAATVARALAALTVDTASAEDPGSPGSPVPAGEPRGGRRRRWLLIGAVGAFAVAAVVSAVAALGVRLPGETSSGTIDLSTAQQRARALTQAATLESEGKGSQALTLYRQVLAGDPHQPQALAEAGWLEFEAGVQAANGTLLEQGQRDEQAAEQADASAYAPHLYLGSMLLVESQPAQAAAEFARFLAAGPPTAEVQTAWPFITRAYTEAGEAVPTPPPGVSG